MAFSPLARIVGCGIIALAACAAPLAAQCEISKFTPPSAPPAAAVGGAMSLSGGRLAVSEANTSMCAVHVLLRTPQGWVEEARIQPDDPSPTKDFGRTLSLSNDLLLVGAPHDNVAGNYSGSAYIFRRVNGLWVQEAKLMASDAGLDSAFGRFVSLAGNLAVVSAPMRGSIYVFRYSANQWAEESKLVLAVSTEYGLAVATDGQTIAAVHEIARTVSFYEPSGSSWTNVKTFNNRKGDTILVSGNQAVAGVSYYSDPNGRGDVIVYAKGAGGWAEQAVLHPLDDPPGEERFGAALALKGDKLLVGAPGTIQYNDSCTTEWVGAAYLFRLTGSQWAQQRKLIGSDPGHYDYFGSAVVIGDDFYAVAAPGQDANGSDRGAIGFYDFVQFTDCNSNELDDTCEISYGSSLDCNNNEVPDECDIANGSSDDCTQDGVPDQCDPDCNNNGIADSCDLAGSSDDCNKNGIPDECDAPFSCVDVNPCLLKTTTEYGGVYFGQTVAIDGNWAIVTGNIWVDGDGRDPSIPGSAFLYTRSGAGWTFHSEITPVSPSGRYAVGSAISGDTLAVVADQTYIRRRNGANWNLEATLPYPDGAIALDEDVLLLQNQLYRRAGSTWVVEATLVSSPATRLWGGDIDGDYAIASSEIYDASPQTPDSGTAFIFHREGNTWVQQAQLLPPEPAANARYGWPVAIDGDYAVVGEPFFYGACDRRPGGIYLYKRSGQNWNLVHRFDEVEVGSASNLGYSIDIKGTRIIVGSSSTRSPAVFELDPTGTYWIRQEDIPSATQNTAGGNVVALSGPWALVGNSGRKKAYFVAVSGDCNGNGVCDLCEIAAGTAVDANHDDRPDSCPCDYVRPAMQDGPQADPYPSCTSGPYVRKNRYLTLIPPVKPDGATGIALRVTFAQMPGPIDCPHVADFSAYQGQQMWVGPEYLAGTMPTGIHRLQPDPYFFDWASLPDALVRVSDCNIVPCAMYEIEAISNLDYPEGTYSSPLWLFTSAVWGDIIANNGAVQPDGVVDFADVSAAVDRFKNAPTALPASRCDLASASPNQGANFNIDFSDISAVVDAFRGRDYSFGGPTAPLACP